MKNQKVIILSFAIVIIGAAFYYVVSNRTTSPSTQEVGLEQSGENTLSNQTLTDGTVIYTVTPKNLGASATTWDFDIKLDTHTGSLDQDLVAQVRLVDDKSNEYKAVGWEGAPPGGHHREGILKFSSVTPRPTSIELKIETTNNNENSSLRWNI
ncbi:MAG: hypothetical protein M1366_00960 [Patescibacteria group bacterium]|nr:hypothetical protein [Patescibacteria group bacterium]